MMRSFLCLLAVGTLTVLVAAGLNIANQGINDLTLSNQGYVIALHLEDEGVYIEAMGEKYPCSKALLQQAKEGFITGVVWLKAYMQELWAQLQQRYIRVKPGIELTRAAVAL